MYWLLSFNITLPPPPTHSHIPPPVYSRAVPYVPKLSELLRLYFNISHMFGRYDRLMWIAGMCTINKIHRNLFIWVNVYKHLWFHQNKPSKPYRNATYYQAWHTIWHAVIQYYLSCLQTEICLYRCPCMLRNHWQLWHTPGSDFIKTKYKFHLKTLMVLYSIFIKLINMSFNITSISTVYKGADVRKDICLQCYPASSKNVTTLKHPASLTLW